MLSLLRHNGSTPELLTSKLFDETSFYDSFLKDLKRCGSELLIESPFVTHYRLTQLLPTLKKLKSRRVRIVVNTKDPYDHDNEYRREDASRAIATLQRIGVQVIFTDGHHRKLAIIDRQILYEGSLNVLSYYDSREVMRRIESTALSWQMIRFTGIDSLLH